MKDRNNVNMTFEVEFMPRQFFQMNEKFKYIQN